MTLRDLIRDALKFNDIDKEVRVRILWRDAEGCAKAEKYIPIMRVDSFGDGPCFVIEATAVNEAKLEKV